MTGQRAGWRRDGGGGPRSSVSIGPSSGASSWSWASTPFPAKDDGSVALGFVVSLEGRQAGHFTWDLAPFPQCRWTTLSTGRCHTTEVTGPSPAPLPRPRSLCVGLSWICIVLTLSFLLSSKSMVGHADSCSADYFSLTHPITCNLNEQNLHAIF